MIFDKRSFRPGEFIFLNDDSNKVVNLNPEFSIFTKEYQRQDLMRYCSKLFWDFGTPIDYGKQIKLALEFYIKNHIKEPELAEIEAIKKAEADQIEAERKAKIPKFSWDRSKNKIKKEG